MTVASSGERVKNAMDRPADSISENLLHVKATSSPVLKSASMLSFMSVKTTFLAVAQGLQSYTVIQGVECDCGKMEVGVRDLQRQAYRSSESRSEILKTEPTYPYRPPHQKQKDGSLNKLMKDGSDLEEQGQPADGHFSSYAYSAELGRSLSSKNQKFRRYKSYGPQ